MSNTHRNLVEGVGINDATYTVKIQEELKKVGGKRTRRLLWVCPYYQTWKNMLHRCFNIRYKQSYPTYKDVTCCKEWLVFSNFKSWMEQQDWEGKCLDKDLLVYKNKIYSPSTCCFLDTRVNNLLVKNDSKRTTKEDHLGVSCSVRSGRTRYIASCWNHSTQRQYEGVYDSAEQAHRAWQKAKIGITNNLIDEYADGVIRTGLQRVIDKIQNDYDNNLITEDF